MTSGLVNVSYIAATILFILALGGLSRHETARRGNLYGIVGMTLALLATVVGTVTANHALLIGGLIIGGVIGLRLALKVKMTQMPELVAILHSLVGLAAVLFGLFGVAVSGADYHGPTGLPWGAVISYLVGAAVLRVLRSQPPRSATP